MKPFTILALLCYIRNIFGQNILNMKSDDLKILDMIANIVLRNLKTTGWNNILFVGEFEDTLYTKLMHLHYTFSVVKPDTEMFFKNTSIIPYHSNTIILKCEDEEDCQITLMVLITHPYWHPHSNFILYYNNTYNKHITAKIFYILWYYKVMNSIIISKNRVISLYTPFISEKYSLDDSFYCSLKNRSMDAGKGFICKENCGKEREYLPLEVENFGTFISFETIELSDDSENLRKLSLFEHKADNMHGTTLKGYGIDVHPFLKLSSNQGTFKGRDGLLWKTIAEEMNFTIRLEPNVTNKFNYKERIKRLKEYRYRSLDLFLVPVYQMDLGVEVDYTFPYVQSGVCFVSHKPETKKILLGSSFVENNYNIVIEFICIFFFMWLVFFLYHSEQIDKFSYDQAGKDLMNTFRMFYSVGVPKIPKRKSFLIFFVIALWGLVVITFINQAFFFYMFSTTTRGKNIDTFEDVLENINNGMVLEGMASHDVSIARMDSKIDSVYAKLNNIDDNFECVKLLKDDTNRICLIDCSIGRYLERSEMNDVGEQYLHVAKGDQIHGLYLNMVLPKHSPMTESFNKHVMRLVESGIVGHWMKGKEKVHEGEKLFKEISLSDLEGIFEIMFIYDVINIVVFTLEVIFGRKK